MSLPRPRPTVFESLTALTFGRDEKRLEENLLACVQEDDGDGALYWLRRLAHPSRLILPSDFDRSPDEHECVRLRVFLKRWTVFFQPADTPHNHRLLANLHHTLQRGFTTDLVSLCYHQRRPRVLNALAEFRLFDKSHCVQFSSDAFDPASFPSVSPIQDHPLLDALLSCPVDGPSFIAQPHLKRLWREEFDPSNARAYPHLDAWPPNSEFALPFYLDESVHWLLLRMLRPSHTRFPTLGLADECVQSLVEYDWLSAQDVVHAHRLASDAFEKYKHSKHASMHAYTVGVCKENPLTHRLPMDEISRDVLAWCEQKLLLESAHIAPFSESKSAPKRRGAL
jgi:hypothetical protein